MCAVITGGGRTFAERELLGMYTVGMAFLGIAEGLIFSWWAISNALPYQTGRFTAVAGPVWVDS